MGASPMNESSPSRNGELDSRNTSHGSATCCIHVPVFDSRLPNKRMVKLRERSARRGAEDWREPVEAGTGVVAMKTGDYAPAMRSPQPT